MKHGIFLLLLCGMALFMMPSSGLGFGEKIATDAGGQNEIRDETRQFVYIQSLESSYRGHTGQPVSAKEVATAYQDFLDTYPDTADERKCASYFYLARYYMSQPQTLPTAQLYAERLSGLAAGNQKRETQILLLQIYAMQKNTQKFEQLSAVYRAENKIYDQAHAGILRLLCDYYFAQKDYAKTESVSDEMQKNYTGFNHDYARYIKARVQIARGQYAQAKKTLTTLAGDLSGNEGLYLSLKQQISAELEVLQSK